MEKWALAPDKAIVLLREILFLTANLLTNVNLYMPIISLKAIKSVQKLNEESNIMLS